MSEKEFKLFGHLKKRDWVFRIVLLSFICVYYFLSGYAEGWNGRLGLEAGLWCAFSWTTFLILFTLLMDLIVWSMKNQKEE